MRALRAIGRALQRLHRWAATWQPTGRQQLAAILVVTATMAFGLWRGETTAAQVARESRERHRSLCQGAIDEQRADQEILLEILSRANARPETFEIINDSYADRPPPAACTAPDGVP